MSSDVLELQVDTSLPQVILELIAEARAKYGPLSISSGFVSLGEDNLWAVIVEAVLSRGESGEVFKLFHPVERKNGYSGIAALYEARNQCITQVLQMVAAGSPPASQTPQAATPAVTPFTTYVIGQQSQEPPVEVLDGPTCEDCHKVIQPYSTGTHVVSVDDVLHFSQGRYGADLCPNCAVVRGRMGKR